MTKRRPIEISQTRLALRAVYNLEAFNQRRGIPITGSEQVIEFLKGWIKKERA